jgi:hypothetical protein
MEPDYKHSHRLRFRADSIPPEIFALIRHDLELLNKHLQLPDRAACAKELMVDEDSLNFGGLKQKDDRFWYMPWPSDRPEPDFYEIVGRHWQGELPKVEWDWQIDETKESHLRRCNESNSSAPTWV